MPSLLYAEAMNQMLSGNLNWTSQTMKLALLNNSYVPDYDAHTRFSDVQSFEISGTNYTAGGVTLGSKALNFVQDSVNNYIADAADASWTNATFTFRWAVLYRSTGTPSTSPLIALYDFGAVNTATAKDVILEVDPDWGLLTVYSYYD